MNIQICAKIKFFYTQNDKESGTKLEILRTAAGNQKIYLYMFVQKLYKGVYLQINLLVINH